MIPQNHIYNSPYKHFYDQYLVDLEESKIEGDAEIDDFMDYEIDLEHVQKLIQAQMDEHEVRSKESNEGQWIYKGMKFDPAFMLDPVKDYYEQLIPRSLKKKLNSDQIRELVSIYDPVTWAEMNLLQNQKKTWKARTSRRGFPYQSQMIRCKSKRIATRAGRRIGKTASIVVRLLHKIFTFTGNERGSTFNVVIFTPNQSQIDLVFKMMEVFIDGNQKLLGMVKDGKIPTRKSPYHMLELTNGAVVKGFVSGSTAIRGQAADVLVLDEGSFLTPDDTDAVVALLNEHEDVEFWVSSTPKGLKDYFYDRVNDPAYVSFYFPTDKYHPTWSREMESDFRSQLTSAGYRHEVLADFSSDGEGVFQIPYISSAKADYEYETQKREPGWVYGIGVDWNDSQNGTQIIVVGYDVTAQRYRVVDKASVNVEGWTQTTAVRTVKDMNRKWRCDLIYTDYGHGATQGELLHEIGVKAPPKSIDKRLLRAQVINFSSALEIRDPWTMKKVKKPVKPYLVNNSVRVFEGLHIDISMHDKLLIKQLEGYRIDRITPTGVPVYAADSKVGDHALDALMLALLGFNMEFSSLAKPKIATNMGYTALGNKTEILPHSQAYQDLALQRDKNREAEELLNAQYSAGMIQPAQSVGITKRIDGPHRGLMNRQTIRRKQF